jgi:hypothetical protein
MKILFNQLRSGFRLAGGGDAYAYVGNIDTCILGG